jgi:hypothetical protein
METLPGTAQCTTGKEEPPFRPFPSHEGRSGGSSGTGWILLAALMQVCLLPGVPAGSSAGNSEDDFVQLLLVTAPRVPPCIVHALLWDMRNLPEPVS